MSPIIIFLVDHQILSFINTTMFLVTLLILRYIEEKIGKSTSLLLTTLTIVWVVSSITTTFFFAGPENKGADIYTAFSTLFCLNLVLSTLFVNGEYLEIDASRIARQLQHSFPKIKNIATAKAVIGVIIFSIAATTKLVTLYFGTIFLP